MDLQQQKYAVFTYKGNYMHTITRLFKDTNITRSSEKN
jgi:hypothetical protein